MTAETPVVPEWLQVGATVAELVSAGGREFLTISKVERFTKTMVVLSNGNRYRLDRLRRHDGDAWGPSYKLLSVTDARVQRARYLNAIEATINQVDAYMRKWRNNPDQREYAEYTIAKLTQFLVDNDGTS